ncbi:hypothetical protein ASPTUDRAFT_685308 [Aspergillus tubingensis CBS 134.48]|uniref:Uncharacterized protein n=1 Tax=Aspergillus tubingensis (strain CBS 134.48) TaxID=767770 RepID=A0A1L9N044_ASPTC|nr:hypothetical protein ASPTUDRAFT_685308 [Aspergillus tubingensis CBS 134.48]
MLPHLPPAPFNVGAKPNKPAVAKAHPRVTRQLLRHMMWGRPAALMRHWSRLKGIPCLPISLYHIMLNRVSPIRPLLGSAIVDCSPDLRKCRHYDRLLTRSQQGWKDATGRSCITSNSGLEAPDKAPCIKCSLQTKNDKQQVPPVSYGVLPPDLSHY